MQTFFTFWQAAAAAGLLLLITIYVQGWRRMRRVDPALANGPRLLALGGAWLALVLALVWPLPDWSNYLLAARSGQKVMLCMIAAPLFWLACPLHIMAWPYRRLLRRPFVQLRRRQHQPAKFIRRATQPLFAWFLYVSVTLLWHDPLSARFLLGERWGHYTAPWLLGLAAIFFWSHIVATTPRLHTGTPSWLLIFSLLGIEIPNMIAGVTIAFSHDPVYAYYAAVQSQTAGTLPLSPMNDQIMGGAIVWVFGSFVYIAAIIFVLHGLFRREGTSAPQPAANWDDHAKLIAPGLEHRAAHNKLRNVDLNHR